MLISYTLPCMRRSSDLYRVVPYIVTAADASPPVEVVVVDYANDQALEPLLPAHFVVPVFRGREHYHMAHSKNIGIRQASGDVIVIAGTDLLPHPDFFQSIRRELDAGAKWLVPSRRGDGRRGRGHIVVPRNELIKAGGYDERFEFYGPEDKEMEARLRRRLGEPGEYKILGDFTYTEKEKKFRNYSLSRKEIRGWGRALFKTCNKEKAMVANEGIEWGSIQQPS